MEVPAIQIQTDKGLAMKYADSIDLSNACRAFYQARLESTRRLKEKWRDTGEMDGSGEIEDGCCNGKISSFRRRGSNSSGSSRRGSDNSDGFGGGMTSNRSVRTDGRKMTSLDVAIDVLRREMAALMDQDLYLMKQLLTLNEEIEDLKWRRRYGWSRTSSFCSSDNMIQSAASLGKVDEHPKLEFLTPSSLSLQLDSSTTRLSIYNDDDPVGTFNRSSSLTTSTINANSQIDSQAFSDTEILCTSQNNSNSESNKAGRYNSVTNCETSGESNIEHCNLKQPLESSPDTEGSSSRVSHVAENGHICNGKFTGCSTANHKAAAESSSSAVTATYSNVNRGKDSSRTCDKLIRNKGPKPSPCRNRWTKKLVDADVESQDSGIHDCFGTT